jgi:hypothetical protein
MGYPLTMGSNNTAEKRVSFNKLLPMNVDVLRTPKFQIGAIPNQTVWHNGDAFIHFFVGTDTLKSTPVALSYSIDKAPKGKITFDAQTGRFTYAPDVNDVRNFTVTFTVQAGNKTMSQEVKFIVMAAPLPEHTVFGVESKTEKYNSPDDYIVITQSSRNNVMLNNTSKTVYSYSIAGKELVFDGTDSRLSGLNNNPNIDSLTLYAEKITISMALSLPQTKVTIYAKELVFEDNEKVIGSINTTPQAWSSSINGNGAMGAKAGDIKLYIKDFKQSASAFRFICNGGNGQNANTTPGNGGTGGTVTSTVNVQEFCDLTRGVGGVNSNNSVYGINGSNGTYSQESNQFAWLHPYWISTIVRYGKDAYLNGYVAQTKTTFTEYSSYITQYTQSGKWVSAPHTQSEKMELDNARTEMQTILSRIEQNLDYFGNPIGWVPMLSFEVEKAVFEQEIKSAINVLYLSYWLKNINAANTQRIVVAEKARNEVETELTTNKDKLNKCIGAITNLQSESEILEGEITDLSTRIEQKRVELEGQAKNNINRRDKMNKVAGVLKAVAAIAPVACSIIPGVGTAIGVAIGAAAEIGSSVLSKYTNAVDTAGYGKAVEDMFAVTNKFYNDGGFSAVTGALGSIKISDIKGSADTVKKAYEATKPLIDGVQNLHTAFMKNTASSEQIQIELNRLQSESKEYQQLAEEASVLTIKKEDVLQKLVTLLNDISSLSVEIQNGISTIDGLSRDIFTNSSQRDLRAMQYIDNMERRAKERLLKYHYYVAKSYEYRLLESYKGGLDLSKLFNEFVAIAYTNNTTLSEANFNTLQTAYNEQLSTITESILKEYNNGSKEFTTSIHFSLSKEDITELNEGRDVILNMMERGMILSNHENARIVNVKVSDIKVHLEGEQNSSIAQFELLLEHSGISKLRKNGEIYYFNHSNSQTKKPIQWGMMYYAKTNKIYTEEQSFASESLLYSLLKIGDKEKFMMYSRPAVWADIRITKNDVTTGNTQMIIDELTFELQYDFMQRPNENKNIDVYACDIENTNRELMPYIEVSAQDKGKRQNGRGALYRTYNTGTTVTLTAQEEYGNYQFVQWVDRNNTLVSKSATVNVSTNSDATLIAKYQYSGAVLHVPDTVYITNNAGQVSFSVSNKGLADLLWSAESKDSWLRIADNYEGVNNAAITLEHEINPTQKERKGYITITTEDGEQKTVVVVQRLLKTDVTQTTSPQVRVYPNPVSTTLSVEYAGSAELEVRDMRGRCVFRTTLVDNETISTEEWKSGVYILTLKTKNNTFVHKILKK